MKELRNSVCIVGADESDELGTLPNKSMLTLHLEAVRNAVRDAGLKISDVDGVFTAGQHSPATIGEALGIVPRYIDGTTVGPAAQTLVQSMPCGSGGEHRLDVEVPVSAPAGSIGSTVAFVATLNR